MSKLAVAPRRRVGVDAAPMYVIVCLSECLPVYGRSVVTLLLLTVQYKYYRYSS